MLLRCAAVPAYRNTIPLEKQGAFPGDLAMETRITAIMRWNALAMVVRANKAYGELGGHVASYASAAEIFELGFNHFFRARPTATTAAIWCISSRTRRPASTLALSSKGRLERGNSSIAIGREIGGRRPQLLSTSLADAGILADSDRLDGHRADQRRSIRRASCGTCAIAASPRPTAGASGASLATAKWTSRNRSPASRLAAREKLDNLTFIINCNLQRLDGPVRGNGQIIQELEMIFRGAGWNVIKVLWGTEWDVLFARDVNHALLRRFAATVDGKYQTLGAKDGAYNLTHFFDEDPEVRALVAHMSDRRRRRAEARRPRFPQALSPPSNWRRRRGTADGHPRQDQEGFWHGRSGRSRG